MKKTIKIQILLPLNFLSLPILMQKSGEILLSEKMKQDAMWLQTLFDYWYLLLYYPGALSTEFLCSPPNVCVIYLLPLSCPQRCVIFYLEILERTMFILLHPVVEHPQLLF